MQIEELKNLISRSGGSFFICYLALVRCELILKGLCLKNNHATKKKHHLKDIFGEMTQKIDPQDPVVNNIIETLLEQLNTKLGEIPECANFNVAKSKPPLASYPSLRYLTQTQHNKDALDVTSKEINETVKALVNQIEKNYEILGGKTDESEC